MKCEFCSWFWYDDDLARECCHFDYDGSYSALGILAPCEREDIDYREVEQEDINDREMILARIFQLMSSYTITVEDITEYINK